MPLQENVASRLAYKFYASGAIDSNSEPDTASDPGASGAQELRRVSSTLALRKDTYQSNEIASHRQVSSFRHGTKRPAGEISGELSPGTYWEFMEAACRGTEEASFSKTESDFTSVAADNATSKFTVGGSTWAAEDFRVGDVIRFTNLSDAQNNSRNFLITGLSTVDATVTPAPDTMTADTAFTVTRVGKKVSIPESGFVKRKVAIEHYHEDVDIAELFTEGRISGMRVQMPATGNCTITFPITARNKAVFEDSAAPYFTSPAAVTSTDLTAAVSGKVIHQGAAVGIITGIEFTLAMNVDAPAVSGQDIVPDIFLGRSVVTGTITLLFEDATFLNAFNDETEVELLLLLEATSADDSPFIAFTMSRVKLGSADAPLQGEAGIPISCQFQALKKATATGYVASTLVIQDSEAA